MDDGEIAEYADPDVFGPEIPDRQRHGGLFEECHAVDQRLVGIGAIEILRQDLVEGLVRAPEPLPPPLRKRLEDLQRAHAETLSPVEALAESAREEARGVLVVRVPKDLGRPVKKALLSRLEARAPVGVVIEGRAVTAATFREDLDLSRVDELTAGRSDYRFTQVDDQGAAIVRRLGRLVEEQEGPG